MGTCALVGATEFNSEDFLARHKAGEFDMVIAVDGGFAHLEQIGVRPDMAMGDFDSLGYVPQCARVCRFPVMKDQTDMDLALEKGLSFGHRELVVYGGIGGRLDHTLANLQVLAKYSEREARVTAVADTFAVRMVTGPDAFEVPGEQCGTVSVFAMNDACTGVIEQGLAYEIEDVTLTNRVSLGVSNVVTDEGGVVAVESGTLAVFYPLVARLPEKLDGEASGTEAREEAGE